MLRSLIIKNVKDTGYELHEYFCLLIQLNVFFGTFEVKNLSWTLPLVTSENTILCQLVLVIFLFPLSFFSFFGNLEVSLDFLGRELCLVSFSEGSSKLLSRSLRLQISTPLCFCLTSARSLVSFSVCVVAVFIMSCAVLMPVILVYD